MSTIKYNKLVRVRMPEIINNKGHNPITERLKDKRTNYVLGTKGE